MIERHVHKNITWLDALNPSPEEVRELVNECGIPPEFANDLNTETPKTEVHAKKGALKLTLDFPIVKRADTTRPYEIKFLVTKTHFVTIRFDNIEAIHRFTKEFEMISMLKKTPGRVHTEILFTTMLNYVYDTMYEALDYLEAKLSDIEEEIFNEHEREMVFEISHVSRRLISFRQTIAAHENALVKLSDALSTAFGAKSAEKVEEMEHHYRSLTRRVYALISTLDDLRDTNNALLSTKQNEIMKLFTILAFITFPLTLFTSMFGMNTVATPIVGQEWDFWLILGVMFIVSVSFFIFFKHKKWM